MIHLYPFCSLAQDLVSMIYNAPLLLPFWYIFPSLNIRVSLKGCTGKKRSPSVRKKKPKGKPVEPSWEELAVDLAGHLLSCCWWLLLEALSETETATRAVSNVSAGPPCFFFFFVDCDSQS